MFLKGNSLGVIKLRNLCGIGLEPSKKCDLFDREKMNPATFSILKPIPTQWHLLMPLEKKPVENIVGKGEIACKFSTFSRAN